MTGASSVALEREEESSESEEVLEAMNMKDRSVTTLVALPVF